MFSLLAACLASLHNLACICRLEIALRKSGEPLFRSVWMRLYEDEIRSVEGPVANRGRPRRNHPFSTSRSLDEGHDNPLRHDLLQPPLGIRA